MTYSELVDGVSTILAYEAWRQTGEVGDGSDAMRAAFIAGYKRGYAAGYSQGEANGQSEGTSTGGSP